MSDAPIFALVGATATGKTDLGEELAERLDAEIVCLDSRQVFRDLDAGTGKPDAATRAARPHHLFDALTIDERPSAGWYARAAAPVIEAIRARGKRPLLVGGAGLYLRALQEGLAEEAPVDPAVREALRREHAGLPVEELHARLTARDPDAAAQLRPRDRQRLSRALEVIAVTGGTLTVFDPSVAGCAPFRVSKGQSFVEPADHVHLARNDGKTRVTLYALYMGVGKPSAANVAAERPTGCKG